MAEKNNVCVGSLYELNQEAYNKIWPLNEKEKRSLLSDIYEWVKEQRCDYTMLLCHELRDYTIIRYKDRQDKTYKNAILKDLRECIDNRGKLLDIRYLQDQDAWEIWIRIFKDKAHQNHMYMFFNAEEFIVEV